MRGYAERVGYGRTGSVPLREWIRATFASGLRRAALNSSPHASVSASGIA